MALLNHALPGAVISAGSVRVDGTDVLGLGQRELLSIRGRLVAYVPQDPAAALNPALRIKTQLQEVLELHEPALSGEGRAARVRAMLTDVRLPDDDRFLARFPHQLSGGQQQRVTISMAFLANPRAVVLDEPTTGLDVTTQAHVLQTIRRMCTAHGVAAVYITHDLAAIAGIADRIMVMHAGRVAEVGPRGDVLAAPGHPYGARLLQAVPDVRESRAIRTIPGTAPRPGRRPGGARSMHAARWRSRHVAPCCHRGSR
jgi:peptide/nickel transport system ATP-binding protein